ncbi:hypothetical protein BH23PLA1_BH23PLA1_24870 [soil metagenome]
MSDTPNANPRNPSKAEQAALLLAQGHSIAATGRLVGAGERTVKRWNQSPRFRARVDDHRRGLVDATVGRLVLSSTKAVNVIVELMGSADSDSTRLAAAKAILDKLPALHEYAALNDRMKEIERRLDEQNAGKSPWHR